MAGHLKTWRMNEITTLCSRRKIDDIKTNYLKRGVCEGGKGVGGDFFGPASLLMLL